MGRLFGLVERLQPTAPNKAAVTPLSNWPSLPAAVLGGLGTIAIALLWMKLFPTLREVERLG
jgi:hypothetical protein